MAPSGEKRIVYSKAMKCEKCKDKGIITEGWETLQEALKHETWFEYAARMKRLARDSYCKCKIGQQILFIHKKAEQQIKKRGTERFYE